MSQTVGQRLTEARTKQGLSIEDIAHTTRIRPNTLRDMESDDYSNFPNLTYAKSFLGMYSKHLEVDVSDFIREFGPANAGSLDVMSFLDPVNGARSPSLAGPAPAQRRSSYDAPIRSPGRGHPIFFIIILLGAVGAAYSMYLVARNTSGDGDAAPEESQAVTSSPKSKTEFAGPPSPEDLPSPSTELPPFPFQGDPRETDIAPEPVATPPIPKADNGEPVIVRPAIIEEDDSSDDAAPRAVPFRPVKPE
jgi:transcriptional regulator with XRE-family HTH domain